MTSKMVYPADLIFPSTCRAEMGWGGDQCPRGMNDSFSRKSWRGGWDVQVGTYLVCGRKAIEDWLARRVLCL